MPYKLARGAHRLESRRSSQKHASQPGAVLALFYALLHPAWHWIFPSTHSCKHGCHDPLNRRLSKPRVSNQGPQCSVESATATDISGILRHQPSLLRRSRQAELIGGRHTSETRLELSLLERQQSTPEKAHDFVIAASS